MTLPAQEPFNGTVAFMPDPPWAAMSTFGRNLACTSGQGTVQASGGVDCIIRWDNDTFSNDQYSQVVARFTGPGDDTELIELLVRATGSLASGTFYIFWCDGGSDCLLAKFIAGVSTVLATANATTFTSGDVFKLIANGTAISVTKNGSTILSATDSSVTAGTPGVGAAGTPGTVLFDDWEGGNVSSGPSPGSDSGTITNTATNIGLSAPTQSLTGAESAGLAVGPTEAAGVTESVPPIGLNATEAAALGESVAIALARSDSATVTDSAKVGAVASESVAFADATAAALASATATGDTTLLSDLANIAIVASDAITVGQSVGGIAIPVSSLDAVSLSDTARAATAAISGETISLTDLLALVQSAASTDTATVTESASVSTNAITGTQGIVVGEAPVVESILLNPVSILGGEGSVFVINLVGTNKHWTNGTFWGYSATGTSLETSNIVVNGQNSATWTLTLGPGVGSITISDGSTSATLAVLASPAVIGSEHPVITEAISISAPVMVVPPPLVAGIAFVTPPILVGHAVAGAAVPPPPGVTELFDSGIFDEGSFE